MTPTAGPPALETDHLTKTYGRTTALDDCRLVVPAGSIVGLVGPNGAGKSTLLQLMCGLIRPSSGDLRVFGVRPGARAAHLARVGFVAQDAPVYRGLTVAEHLELGRRLNPGWDAGLAQERVADVGLPMDRRAGALSGGQRAQLALTLAAAKRPELLILDEPAAALDPLARRTFMDSLTVFVRDIGATAVLSSHLLDDVERTCDFLAVLVAGRLQVAAPVDELTSTHRLVPRPAEGDAPARGAQVVAVQGERAVVRVAGDAAATTPGDPAPLADLALAYLGATSADGPARTHEGGGR